MILHNANFKLKTPELVTPTYCDDSEKTPEVEERFLATSVNEDKFSTSSSRPQVTASEAASSAAVADAQIGK